MVIIRIDRDLDKKINKKFKGEAVKIFRLIYSMEETPKKGKIVGSVGGVLIKELKYGKFRFYFTVDGYRIKFWDVDVLSDLIIRFVRMSDKKSQQKVIEEIRVVLRRFGEDEF
jgi:hypothetical protein